MTTTPSPAKPGGFSRDFLASIVVFLVALPLCLGLAIAAGAPPVTGLISGIIGGTVVGLLSGASLQVSGPANGGLAIVADILQQYGLTGLGITVLLAGILQITAGLFRLGQWFRAFSPAVIKGMLAGIGVIIVASQFHVMLDVKPESNGLANLLSIPASIGKGLFPTEDSTHHWAALIGLISILVILAWNFAPKKVRAVPGTLIAVLIAVAIASYVNLPIHYVALPANLTSGMTFLNAHTATLLANPDLWMMAATLSLVLSAETMLSATAIESAHLAKGRRILYDREMIAQGIGNILCGLVGAFPLSGVIARSSVNIQAGAQSRWATVLHGVWMLLLCLLFPHLLELIPTASLAAILIYSGSRLIQVSVIRELWAISRMEVAVYAVTLVTVVCTNLLQGVIAGSLLAVIKLLHTLSNLKGQSVERNGEIHLTLQGSATFLSLPKLVSILERQPLGRTLQVHVDTLNHIDHACLEALQSWEAQYALSGGTVTLAWHALQDKLPGGVKRG